jgi:hypothetical protein
LHRLCHTCRRPIRVVRDSHDRLVALDYTASDDGTVLIVEPGLDEELYRQRAGTPRILNEAAALTLVSQGRELYRPHPCPDFRVPPRRGRHR